jgi:UDP-glucose 4-epimerase
MVGAGFTKSHLCGNLILPGHDAIYLDNFFAGRREDVLDLVDMSGSDASGRVWSR